MFYSGPFTFLFRAFATPTTLSNMYLTKMAKWMGQFQGYGGKDQMHWT